MMATALLGCLALGAAGINYNPHMKTFGHSVKNAHLPPATNVVVFAHKCSSPPCVVTQMHFPSVYPTSGAPWDWQDARLFFTVDGAAFNLTLLEVALEGEVSRQGDTSPYGTSLFGKTAKSGGVYTTVRIPFQSTFSVSIRAADGVTTDSIYWAIVRGTEAYRVVLGDVVLPPTAALRVDRFGPKMVQNLEMVNLTRPSAGTSALVAVMISVNSTSYTYLEGCMRLVDNAGKTLFLSSGTEDYFLSASYFDEGTFALENSGITFKKGGSVSMYKTHTTDPVFLEDGQLLAIRAFEATAGCGSYLSCPNQFCANNTQQQTAADTSKVTAENGIAPNTAYTSLVLRYEW